MIRIHAAASKNPLALSNSRNESFFFGRERGFSKNRRAHLNYRANYRDTSLRGAPVTLLSHMDANTNNVPDNKRGKHMALREDIIPP